MTEPLSPGAAATLYALLTGSDPVSSALRARIPHARVSGRCGCGCGCGCGCPTVRLTVDRTAVPPAPPHDNPVADAWYAEPDGAGVVLFTEDGRLSMLEIHSTGERATTAWPEPRFQPR